MGSKQSWRDVIAVGDVIEFKCAERCKNYIYIGKPNPLQEIGMASDFELLAMEHICDGGKVQYNPNSNYIVQLLRCNKYLRWESIWESDDQNDS